MKPYYDEDGITIYHGDCREVLPQIRTVDLVLTDPPYGIGADRNLRANTQHGAALATSKDYGYGAWDSSPIDDATLALVCSKGIHSIIWGGNYFRLPPSSGWLVWDKDNGNNGYADCELAWTNLSKAVRRFKYRWMGMLQEHMGIHKEYRDHPTQKPVAVMQWAITQAPSGYRDLLDPFMGVGTSLIAARLNGLMGTGIEIEERYCEIAAKRLSQGVLNLGHATA